MFLNKAENIATLNGRLVRSASISIPCPSVIRLKKFIHLPYTRVILTRKNIIKRDGNKCAYCGKSDVPLTVDHIIPKAKGGSDAWENLVAACVHCNNKKGDRTASEAGMKLHVKPYKPTHITFLRYSSGKSEETWKPYLFHS